MGKRERVRIIIGATINIVVFGLAVYCLVAFIKYALNGSPDNKFRYFTNISTLTVGSIALVNASLLVLSAIKSKMIYPVFFSIIKFVGLSMITLTFFTVLFFLAPLTSFKEMYQNMRFITHLVIPLLALISHFFFEEKTIFSWKPSLFGLIPPVIYTIVYGINVVWLKTWPDIYKVNTKGIWYVDAIIIVLFNCALVQGLYFLKKLIIKKCFKEE